MSTKEPQTVHTDALETLGYKIGPEQGRDAIHLAVEPIMAGETLKPGQHVGLLKVPGQPVMAGDTEDPVGIVDPFLTEEVHAGEMFWLVVYPRQIKSLRHVWEHPAFTNSTGLKPKYATPIADSQAWIAGYAASLSGDDYDGGHQDVTVEELMDTAASWCDDSNNAKEGWADYLVKGGLLEGVGTNPLFWKHFEVVTGKKPSGDDPQPNFFSCSC